MTQSRPKPGGRRRRQKVVAIRGGPVPLPIVNRDVVDRLELLLAEAKDGHIAGLVYGTVAPEGHIGSGWDGNASSHSMIAAVTILQHRILVADHG